LSPRRKIQADDEPLFAARVGAPPRRWGLPMVFTLAGLVMVVAVAACTLILISHETRRRAMMQDVAVLAEIRTFMTAFTSPDPFHANDYVDRVLDHATGEFAKQYQDKANEALIQVAKGEPATGTVLDAGVERWNDDGSANVLVATEVTATSPDGKNVTGIAYRWVVTAKQEGDQWKISSLVQVV
jgi:Mce-associated membrane protein